MHISPTKSGIATVLLCLCTGMLTSSHRAGNPDNLHLLNYDTLLKKVGEIWFYNGKRFSGYREEREKDQRVVYQLPILDGLENGLALGWYNSGEKLMERFYADGKKEGVFRQWWPNGNLRYLFHYKNDTYHGNQIVFFPNGSKRQEGNFYRGKEEGLQRTWNEEGLLISNYVIKQNKVYGVITSQSCVPVGH